MTASQSSSAKPKTARRSMHFDGLRGITRTTRLEATRRAEPRGKPAMPKSQRTDKPSADRPRLSDRTGKPGRGGFRRARPLYRWVGIFHCLFARAHVFSRARSMAAPPISRLALGRAMTTRSNDSGSEVLSRRNHSRTPLLMRLRTTALPTLRLTLIPRRRFSGASPGAASKTNSPLADLFPPRERRLKSRESRNPSARAKRPVSGTTTIWTPR